MSQNQKPKPKMFSKPSPCDTEKQVFSLFAHLEHFLSADNNYFSKLSYGRARGRTINDEKREDL